MACVTVAGTTTVSLICNLSTVSYITESLEDFQLELLRFEDEMTRAVNELREFARTLRSAVTVVPYFKVFRGPGGAAAETGAVGGDARKWWNHRRMDLRGAKRDAARALRTQFLSSLRGAT